MDQPRSERRGADRAAPAADCRCLCGSLLARVVEGGVELKCRRCKRTLLVPLDAGAPVAGPPGRRLEVVPVRQVG